MEELPQPCPGVGLIGGDGELLTVGSNFGFRTRATSNERVHILSRTSQTSLVVFNKTYLLSSLRKKCDGSYSVIGGRNAREESVLYSFLPPITSSLFSDFFCPARQGAESLHLLYLLPVPRPPLHLIQTLLVPIYDNPSIRQNVHAITC
ncbi:hypothetical protein PM082_023868 [Marasmius tenuissimus]|nr:hypothetical protein PM082_023868 [Marasmius tenuissimus]